ncbi:CHC2 zinc finger domain-containing protein [Aquimarina sp. ERC-38]|uniref:CHC2 zinc finger domain-containing protein n=1 Tax=Aquimarina sp. ERC-38 TaxID=2949996 RepID=UPI0022458830|nr:CHC2 zinc finger domain-containing protein [Aquimarina sp. ERC-38]UZO80656.1 CHC2 zinc finger domain-containing protein [Aquimarina sp. ERC-38]UZO80670.1 CHC2 zinc finger domain-containing protein [Aquimarina sp. ERC-38]
MDIAQIKANVDIINIATELGLQLDKSKKCLCPFHKEKTPSLQFSREKQIATCFSANCDAGSMDVIDLVKKFYSWELPQALKWLESKASGSNYSIVDLSMPKSIKQDYPEIFDNLKNKLGKSSKAREYLKGRHIDYKKVEAGFNTGKDHHELKYCIVFPLKNKNGEITSLYGRSIYNNAKSKHYYTTNRKGLYPNYPNPETKTLIITESIIDTVTLQQCLPDFFDSKENQVLTAYGTNGITSEHITTIKELKQLQEIIFWMDGDNAGEAATDKYAKDLHKLLPQITMSKIEMLENEDINSLLDTHEPEILQHLYKGRKTIQSLKVKSKSLKETPTLQIKENHAVYEDSYVKIELMGRVDLKDLSKLKVTTVIHNVKEPYRTPSRNNADLYNDDQVEKLIRKTADKIELGTIAIREAMDKVTRDLEVYRLQQQNQTQKVKKERYELRSVTLKEQDQAKRLLQSKDLKQTLIQKLQQTGIIGEEKNALFLFTILLSRKMPRTLNAMVQGTSGSGKSHLIKKVADCMYDQNKIKRFTRVTDKSFYNYGEYDLQNCGIILEDYDGLTEEAELAWRELQSNHKLSSSVSQKNELTGEIATGEKYVFGPIASLVATTNFRIYEDNESRVFVIAIDESEAQTEKVLDYMAKKASKVITDDQEKQVIQELQNVVYMLKPSKVKNPYRLELPKTTKQRRRLTQMLHDYIEQITLLHQYQRQQESGLLITELQDLEIAIELMFNSIVLKTDELDGILRQFYEDLKKYVEKKGKSYEFTMREIRQHFRISKTQMFRYFTELQELEYITRSGIGARNMHKFQVCYWDNIEKLRQEIREHLTNQIERYKSGTQRNSNGTLLERSRV